MLLIFFGLGVSSYPRNNLITRLIKVGYCNKTAYEAKVKMSMNCLSDKHAIKCRYYGWVLERGLMILKVNGEQTG